MSDTTIVRPMAFQTPARKTRLLLASLPIFAGLLSEDGRVLECNFGPLGGPMEGRMDWVGRAFETGPWWSYSEASRADVLIMLGRAQKGEPISKERLYQKADGTMGVMSLSLKPLFAPYGQPDAILVTAVDVTERRQETDIAAHIAHDMAHRLRNSFTIMRTLATRSVKDANQSEDIADAQLSDRLSRIRSSQALSYRYLFFDVPIQDIVAASLEDPTQLSRYDYDPVSIPSDHIEMLMLAFGELSRPGYKAELVASRVGPDRLELVWTEAEARPEDHLPTDLIEALIKTVPEQKTGGKVTIQNGETGFSWTFQFPKVHPSLRKMSDGDQSESA